MTTLDDFIRGAVEAYLARTNMSAREFGVLALGGPGFVSSLESGRSMRLDTADRLLQFMDEAPIGPKFREEVEAFLSRTDMKPYKLGEEPLGERPSPAPATQDFRANDRFSDFWTKPTRQVTRRSTPSALRVRAIARQRDASAFPPSRYDDHSNTSDSSSSTTQSPARFCI